MDVTDGISVVPTVRSLTTTAVNNSSNWNTSEPLQLLNSSEIQLTTVVGISTYDTSDYDVYAGSYYTTFFIIGAVIMIGNLLTLAAVVTTPKIRLKSYVMMTSLAVTDVMCGLITMNFALHELLTYPSCSLATYRSAMRPLERLFPHSSFMHIAAIAIDRYVAVIYPLDYETRMTSTKLGLIIGAVWLTAACLSFPPYLAFADIGPAIATVSCIKTEWTVFDSAGNLINYVINSTVVVTVYRRMWSIAMQHEKQLQNQLASANLPTAHSSVRENVSRISTETQVAKNGVADESDKNSLPLQDRRNNDRPATTSESANDGGGGGGIELRTSVGCHRRLLTTLRKVFRRKLTRRHRATRTVLVLTVSYVVLWFPYNVANLMIMCGLMLEFAVPLQAASVLVGYVNVALNVVVYVTINRDFRSAFRRIFCVRSQNAVQPLP